MNTGRKTGIWVGLFAGACSLGIAAPAYSAPHSWAEGSNPEVSDGAAKDYYNRGASLRWRQTLGDWRDRDGVEYGNAPWATAIVEDTDSPRYVEWDVREFVQAVRAGDVRDEGVFLRGDGNSVFASREHDVGSERPELVVTIAGTPTVLAATADTFTAGSTVKSLGGDPEVTVSAGNNAMLRFDLAGLPAGPIESATLRLFTLRQYGTNEIGVYVPDPGPVRGEPEQQAGLAAEYIDDDGIADHPDVVMFEDYESDDWMEHWSQLGGTFDLADDDPTFGFEPLAGRGLRVLIAEGSTGALNTTYDFMDKVGEEPDEIYLRYYLRLGADWNQTVQGGKLPGIAGTYGVAGWGGRRSDGTNGWSARGSFSLTIREDTNNPLAGHTVAGSYIYHADMPTAYGDGWAWNEGWGENAYGGLLATERWYCMEYYVRLNAVDDNDGIVRAWVDGRLSFEKEDMRFRTVDTLKIEQVWMNIYHGGTTPSPYDQHAFIDNVVIARSYIGPMGPIDEPSDESGGEDSGSGGPADGDSGESGDEAPGSDAGAGETTVTSGPSDGTGAGAGQDGDGDGSGDGSCSCRSQDRSGASWLVFALLGAVFGRRQGSSHSPGPKRKRCRALGRGVAAAFATTLGASCGSSASDGGAGPENATRGSSGAAETTGVARPESGDEFATDSGDTTVGTAAETAADGSSGGPEVCFDGVPAKPAPLAELPSCAGPHIADIEALAPGEWLELGVPQADPEFGTARGRSWSSLMPPANDLGGAFLKGEGKHGWSDPETGYYMDDLWFYDLLAHRWICLYPGTNINDPPLTINDDGFLAHADGRYQVVAPMGHAYNQITYDSDRQRFMGAYSPGGHYYPGAFPWLDPLLEDPARNVTNGSPWMYVASTGEFDRRVTSTIAPPGLPYGLKNATLVYLEGQDRVFAWLSGTAVWFYDTQGEDWSERLDGSGPPPAYGGWDMHAVHDTARNDIYIYGSPLGNTLEQGDNALWKYDVDANAWSDVQPSGSLPMTGIGNWGSSMAYDKGADAVMLFNYDLYQAETPASQRAVWRYDVAANAWASIDEIPGEGTEWVGAGNVKHAFYNADLDVHVFFLAGDSGLESGTVWVYRAA